MIFPKTFAFLLAMNTLIYSLAGDFKCAMAWFVAFIVTLQLIGANERIKQMKEYM